MKLNVLQRVMGLDGKEVEQAPTLRDICIRSLVELGPNDQHLTGVEKFNMGMLAQKIYLESEPDLAIEEISKLKERIGLVGMPLVVTWAWNLLEGKG